MFDHPDFDVYQIDDIPLNTEIFLRDEIYMFDWEVANLNAFKGEKYEAVGYVSWVAAENVLPGGVELSWFPNFFDRHHQLSIFLPRDKIRACVGAWQWGEKPSLFVDSEWLRTIHTRSNCVFGLIDAIGVRKKIISGGDLNKTLPALRAGIDKIAKAHPQVSFVSFADSLILKSHWTSGYFLEKVRYTYDPESVLLIFRDLQKAFQQALGLNIYGIFTQGVNEYGLDSVIHISESKNHICLNSLGAPFADLKAIEEAVRSAIHKRVHAPCDLYLDKRFFFSLKINREKHSFFPYTNTLTSSQYEYACVNSEEVIGAIQEAGK